MLLNRVPGQRFDALVDHEDGLAGAIVFFSERWPCTAWLHDRLGLFGDYRVRYWVAPESAPGR